MSKPWLKFYPVDWRGDQALAVVSLAARGLWIDMIALMHEATPYGHLIVGAKPLSDADLSRLVGASLEEVQALLVELLNAGVARRTRTGVIYSKRMIADDKKAIAGRKAKLEAIEKARQKAAASRGACRDPSPQRLEARGRVEAPNRASTPTESQEAISILKDEEGDAMERLRAIVARQIEEAEKTDDIQTDVPADGHSAGTLRRGEREDGPGVRGQLPDRRQA